jgi:hypothetical protein
MIDTPPPARGVFEPFLKSTTPAVCDQLMAATRGASIYRCNLCWYRQITYAACFMCGAADFERLLDDEQ